MYVILFTSDASTLHGVLDYITSPGIVIPVLVLLFLVINYLISQTGLLRDINSALSSVDLVFLLVVAAVSCFQFQLCSSSFTTMLDNNISEKVTKI